MTKSKKEVTEIVYSKLKGEGKYKNQVQEYIDQTIDITYALMKEEWHYGWSDGNLYAQG